ELPPAIKSSGTGIGVHDMRSTGIDVAAELTDRLFHREPADDANTAAIAGGLGLRNSKNRTEQKEGGSAAHGLPCHIDHGPSPFSRAVHSRSMQMRQTP